MGDLGIGEIISLAGLATSAAGAGLGLEAGAEGQNAMNKVFSQDLGQQENLRRQNMNILNTNIDQSTPQEAKKEQGQGAQQAIGQYENLQSLPAMASSPGGPGGGASPSASQAVVGDDANARANILNNAAAPVQGLNDWQTQQWINNLKAKTALQQNNQFAQQDIGLLPTQLNAAQHSSQGMASIGSLLNTLGGLAGVAGKVGTFGNASAGSYPGQGQSWDLLGGNAGNSGQPDGPSPFYNSEY